MVQIAVRFRVRIRITIRIRVTELELGLGLKLTSLKSMAADILILWQQILFVAANTLYL